MTAAKKDILQGWKDIAAYVSRDVRTVKRWEKQRGLPVRRMPGDGRANVYALISELDGWLSSGVPVEIETATETDTAAFETRASLSGVPTPYLRTTPREEKQYTLVSRRWRHAAAALLSLGAVTALALGIRAHRRDAAITDIPPLHSAQTAGMVKYSSRVSGVDALYLRGLYLYEQRTPETLDRALKCFQTAIAKDPSYAPAYAGLAQTYNLMREYSTMPEAEAYAKAQAAAEHAIALDPHLAEAHASLGFVKFFWDWDAAGAEREFRTSLALDPNSALAHHWYGSMLTHQGRFDESLAQLSMAQHLQPTSTSILGDRAFALGLSGHRNEAADMLQEAINEDPRPPGPHFILSCLSLIEPRDIPRYLDETRRFAMLRHDSEKLHMLDAMEPAYRSGGAPALWHAIFSEEERLHPGVHTFSMAESEVALGRNDDAFRDLVQLAVRRDPQMRGIVIDPLLAPIRQDPRFAPIAAAVDMPLKH
jgi:tetratricopeptide (TPR) repeat protein